MADKIVTCREGFKWLVREASFFAGAYQDAIAANPDHERGTLAFLRSRSGADRILVDVGAHLGYFSIRLAKHFREILAIEPDPFNFEGLVLNLRLNDVRNVIPLSAAAGARAGRAVLFCGGGGGSFIKRAKSTKLVEVDVRPLDDLVERADWIKVDTEGHELEILKGAARLRSEGPGWILENHESIYKLQYWKGILALMEGYSCRQLEALRYVFEVKR